MSKSFSPLKVAIYAATPFKSLASFEHYFALSTATSGSSGFQDRKLVLQFRLLLATLLYCSCLLVCHHYLLPPSSPEVRLLTLDIVYFTRLPGRFSLLLSTQSTMAAYYVFLFYFRPNIFLNRLLSSVLFGHRGGGSRFQKPQNQFQTIKNYLFLKSKRRKMLCGSLPLTGQLSLFESVFQVALNVSALTDLFTLGADFVAVVLGVRFSLLYWKLFLNLETWNSNSFSYFENFTPLSVVLLSTLLVLLHAAVEVATVYAYVVVVSLAGNFIFVVLSYVHLLLRENGRQLREVLFNYRNNCSTTTFIKVLHENLSIFRLLFQMDAFIGNAFFAFLLANLPNFAFCSTMVLFNGRLLAEDPFALFILSAIALYQFVGTLVVHVLLARLSRHLHSSAALLVSYSAQVGVVAGNHHKKSCQLSSIFSLRHQLTLWTHTMRLLTVRRYGITYGVIGSLVTMATFARVRDNGILEFWSLN